jgi:hypothetical protein
LTEDRLFRRYRGGFTGLIKEQQHHEARKRFALRLAAFSRELRDAGLTAKRELARNRPVAASRPKPAGLGPIGRWRPGPPSGQAPSRVGILIG